MLKVLEGAARKVQEYALLALITVLLLVGFAPAYAAVPAVIGTEITAMQTDALAVVDLVWPFVLAVIGAFILFKIVKRGVNKA